MARMESPEQQGPVSLTRALEDHSAEGVQILFSEPAPMIRLSLLLICSMVVAFLVWSFIGRADVIVAAPGVLGPEEEVRRVYAPAEGELEGMLVREGDPVSVGDPIARVRSRSAIQLAAAARQAELELTDLELEAAQFPATLALLEQESALMNDELQAKQQRLDRRVLSGTASLRQEQLARLKQTRGELERARSARSQTQRKWASYRELSGAAISEVEVENARIEYEQASAAFAQADANLRALELQFINESAQDRAELAALRLELENLRINLGRKRMEIEQAPNRLDIRVAAARAKADASRRVRFEDGGDANILIVLAPVNGVVTEVALNQTGDKIQANAPMISIAPEGARKMLLVNIAEQDRGFLVEGRPVKMKFNAFPYQRHGFIEGTLEYISPTTQRSDANQPPAYKGFVSLQDDHFVVAGQRQYLRYGMSALAEIVVRERRLIDMAIDPLRGI